MIEYVMNKTLNPWVNHMDKMFYWRSNQASEWERKVILVALDVAWLLDLERLVFQKLLIYWDFHKQPYSSQRMVSKIKKISHE